MNRIMKPSMGLLRPALIALTALSLTACATSSLETSPHFGQASLQNIAVQAVEPTAEQKNNTYIPADANRQAIAREKYRNNEVEEPKSIGTR